MTMTEFMAIMQEMSEVRASLGRVHTRVDSVALSLAGCQAICASDLQRRRGWVRWTGGIVAALVPAALLYYLRR